MLVSLLSNLYGETYSIDKITGLLKGFLLSLPVSSFLHQRFPSSSPLTFYRELFPSGCLDERGAFTKEKYCGVAVTVDSSNKAKRYTICDDLTPIGELVANDEFCIISPVSYAGKTQRQHFARHLYAIAFDLDGLVVSDDGRQVGLEDLVHQVENGILPRPTYIVASGSGVHCYYFLDTPLPLYSNYMKKIRSFRTALTKKLWNQFTTELWQKPQYESVTQSFRAVGSICKDGIHRVEAFRVGDKVSVEYLNGFVPPKARIKDLEYTSSLSLDDAKEKYPDWYEKRIVQGQPRGTWRCSEALYDWWIEQIESGATVGHRYFCVMCLAVYARKCGITRERLEKDALRLLPFLESQTIQPDNHFDKGDVMKALEAYKASYITFPRATIEELTSIEIPENKRNWRTREAHLRYMRGIRSLKHELGETEFKGAHSKKQEVIDYLRENPGQNITQVSIATGISRKTVAKYAKEMDDSRD